MGAATVEHGKLSLGLAVAHDDKINALDKGVGGLIESERREVRYRLWAHKGGALGFRALPRFDYSRVTGASAAWGQEG